MVTIKLEKRYINFLKLNENVVDDEWDEIVEKPVTQQPNKDDVFIRNSSPSVKETTIQKGEFIVFQEMKKNKKDINKFSILRLNDGKRYLLSIRSFSNYYDLITNRNTVNKEILELVPILQYVPDMDYIKGDEDGESISFLPKNRVERVEGDKWKSTQRTQIRIGRFLKKVLVGKSDAEIEALTNQIKTIAKWKKAEIFPVQGEEIRHWYNGNNYTRRHHGGTLHNSCMRHGQFGYKFDIYAENPDKCKLLIYLDEERKLLARALLWETTDGWYMDRVYYVNDYERQMFNDYARKNRYMSFDHDKGKRMKVRDLKITDTQRCDFPYMDTFRYIYPKDNCIRSYIRMTLAGAVEANCA